MERADGVDDEMAARTQDPRHLTHKGRRVGDVLHDQNLGYALALGMILITGVSNGLYIWLRARSERWLR